MDKKLNTPGHKRHARQREKKYQMMQIQRDKPLMTKGKGEKSELDQLRQESLVRHETLDALNKARVDVKKFDELRYDTAEE